jgi:hypothetical protein
MLNEEEQKELKKLSAELREKLLKVFSSPKFNSWLGFRTQLDKVCDELINKPKQIEEDIDYDKFKDAEGVFNENADKIINAISATSRGKAETSLKWMKEIQDLVKIERALWDDLTPEDQKKAGQIVTTTDLRKAALDGK